MKKQRKHYTPEEKVAILRRHLLEQVPISELCDKQGLQPTVFYRRQKELFENGAAAFQPKARFNHSAEEADGVSARRARIRRPKSEPRKRNQQENRYAGSANYGEACIGQGYRLSPIPESN